jgi:hypothetical protein
MKNLRDQVNLGEGGEGGSGVGGRFEFYFRLQSASRFFCRFCICLGDGEGSFSRAEIESAVYNQRAILCTDVVVSLSHTLARTYIFMYIYIYIYIYIYLFMFGQLGSICLIRPLNLWYYFSVIISLC